MFKNPGGESATNHTDSFTSRTIQIDATLAHMGRRGIIEDEIADALAADAQAALEIAPANTPEICRNILALVGGGAIQAAIELRHHSTRSDEL